MSKKGNGAREKDHSVDSYENPIVAFDNGDDSPSGRGSTSSERTLTEIETIGDASDTVEQVAHAPPLLGQEEEPDE
jgi:hypothetical protein